MRIHHRIRRSAGRPRPRRRSHRTDRTSPSRRFRPPTSSSRRRSSSTASGRDIPPSPGVQGAEPVERSRVRRRRSFSRGGKTTSAVSRTDVGARPRPACDGAASCGCLQGVWRDVAHISRLTGLRRRGHDGAEAHGMRATTLAGVISLAAGCAGPSRDEPTTVGDTTPTDDTGSTDTDDQADTDAPEETGTEASGTDASGSDTAMDETGFPARVSSYPAATHPPIPRRIAASPATRPSAAATGLSRCGAPSRWRASPIPRRPGPSPCSQISTATDMRTWW